MTIDYAALGLLACGSFIGLVLITPFFGVLVRYRANYSPKNIHLDGDDALLDRDVGHHGLEVKGYFAMMRCVYKLEGWTGMYKGFMPLLLYTSSRVMLVVLSVLAQNSVGSWSIFVMVFIMMKIIEMVILYPLFAVIANRAICTPYVFSFFSPRLALHVLLTPTERCKPWKLICIPRFTHILSFLLGVVGGLLSGVLRFLKIHLWPQLVVHAILFALISLFVTPLDVMTARLSLQRVHDEKDFVEGQPMTEAEQALRLELQEYCMETDVLGLRDELDPYKSLYGCFLHMKQEEGWRVLYRAYWATVLILFVSLITNV